MYVFGLGSAGAFCKHQALVHQKFGGAFPNCPPITSADRFLLAQLALGDKCPPKTMFLGMKETVADMERELSELQQLYTMSSEHAMPLLEQNEDPRVRCSTLNYDSTSQFMKVSHYKLSFSE